MLNNLDKFYEWKRRTYTDETKKNKVVKTPLL